MNKLFDLVHTARQAAGAGITLGGSKILAMYQLLELPLN